MPEVILNKFDGGFAEDVRELTTDRCEESLNFDIFSEPHRLSPRRDTEADTISSGSVAMDTARITQVLVAKVASTDKIVGIGKNTSGSFTGFYSKSNIGDTFVLNAATVANQLEEGSGIVYKNKAYAVDYNGSNTYRLLELTDAITVTAIGNISYTKTGSETVIMFVHPDDNYLYIIIGNTISVYTGSALSTATTTLPTGFYGTSMTNYGGYVALVAQPFVGKANPICYLWGRDTTLNTFQDSMELGEGFCGLVENLDNTLTFIMSPYDDFTSNFQNKIITKVYSGGAVQTVKEINVSSTYGKVKTVKVKRNNRIYFLTATCDCVWVFGRNKDGQYTITKDYFASSGSSATISSLSFIGDYMWAGVTVSSVYSLQKTSGTTTDFDSTSSYKTLINPSMPIGDRGKEKQLKAVQIMVTGASSGTTGVKLSVDGSSMTAVISESNATGEQVYEAAALNDGTEFLTGREFQFQLETTGGAKIKEFRYRYETNTTQF